MMILIDMLLKLFEENTIFIQINWKGLSIQIQTVEYNGLCNTQWCALSCKFGVLQLCSF